MAQVDRDLTTVDYFDQLLGLIKNLGRHRDDISMDFIVGLPLTARKKDCIWVILDRLTKIAHFIAVHTTYSVQQYAELYMDHIVRLHGIPKTIISDRGTQFVARFWEQLHECLGTKLIRSSSYHP
jgi:hypothetical protein